MTDWFKNWFDSELYQKVYSHRNISDANNILELVTNNIRLNENPLILDAACGNGRHILTFSKLAKKIIGFDLSKTQLKKAVKLLNENSVDNSFLIQSDVRNISFKTKFDLILNLFTSFGYFENDDDNFQFIINSKQFINLNGVFVLDIINKKYLINNIIKMTTKTYEDYNIVENRELSDDFIIKKIEVTKELDKKIFYEKVKLYDKSKIVSIFESVGYQLIEVFGNYNGESYNSNNSERMIMVFRYVN